MAEEVKQDAKAKAEGEESGAKRKSGKLILIGGAVLAMAGAYATTVMIPPLDGSREEAKVELQKGYVALANALNGNLIGEKFRHMYSLNVAFAFEAVDATAAKASFEDEQQLSRLKSRLNAIIAKQHREDLYTSEFKQQLKEAVDQVVFADVEGEVTEVLLTNVVIQ
ncbi:MAG: flagellar basal body-associated FliL family protein [Planctomycetota bacterium]